jgi:RimJ/RimL family protein N-acetyltransferase
MDVISERNDTHIPELRLGRICLRPLELLDNKAWRRVHSHFKDPEIAYLNGTPPSRMPLWLLRRVLKADSRRSDRQTFGIFSVEADEEYIGTIELYDLAKRSATLGIIIGERHYWGKGYGSEAIHALLDYAFNTLGLEDMRLHTFADNLRAQACFKKVGFVEMRRVPAANDRTDVQMRIAGEVWRYHNGDSSELSAAPATPRWEDLG